MLLLLCFWSLLCFWARLGSIVPRVARSYDLLLDRLCSVAGLFISFWKWCRSFLDNRVQQVRIGTDWSRILEESGVGFQMYANDPQLVVDLQSETKAAGNVPGTECSASQPAPLAHVEQYETVVPLRVEVMGRSRRDADPEQASQNMFPDAVKYNISVQSRNYTLHLEKNRGLLSKNYTEIYYLEDGTEVREQPDVKDHCFYHGSVLGIKDSSVSISTCSGLRGFFQTDSQTYLIEPLPFNFGAEGAHAVYKYEHLRTKRATCGTSNVTIYDNGPRVAAIMSPSHWKSSTLQKGARYIELFLVVDNTEYRRYKDLVTVRHRMREIVNQVDKLYRSLNFRVALIGLEVWTREDPITISSDASITLDNFLAWRKKFLMKKKKHDNAQLVTGVDFYASTVGLATKLAMCTADSGGVNQDHNENPIGAASTMAHEMGHNLGMSHDEDLTGCNCAISKDNGGCVMAKSVGMKYPQFFSSCSRDDLQSFLSNSKPSCLGNEPDTGDLYGSFCGNMFVEQGEECDCGRPEECTNPCCNATTCRLKNGVECAHGECCHQCQFRPVGDVCRRSQGDCDLPEFCTGKAAECPDDDFQENGTPCLFGEGHCYNGACPSHAQHCQYLWGPDAQKAASECFQKNIDGTQRFHCKKTGQGYAACKQRDVMCGLLHCMKGENLPITRRMVWTRMGSGAECKVAEVPADEPWDSVDPTIVPTGTKCGKEMVCYEGQCQGLTVYGARNCSAKCSNRGVCNHKRQCHCDPGWAPPDCSRRLSDSATGSAGLTLVAVLVSLILLAIVVIGGIVYYKRRRTKTSQKSTSSASGLSNPLFRERNNKSATKSDNTQIIGQPRLIATTSDIQEPTSVYITMLPNSRPSQSSPAASPIHQRSPIAPMKMAQVAKPSAAPPVPPSHLKKSPRVHANNLGVPKAVPVYPQLKPNPPTKPLPQLKEKQAVQFAQPPAALIPPTKPTFVKPNQSQVSHPKVALKPPVMRR